MTFTPIMAFAFIALTFMVGDYIALKTRGVVSTFITAIVVFILFGSVFKLIPSNIMELSGLTALIPTFGMVLILTNLGSTLDLNELRREWRTILVSLGGVIGIVVLCFTVGQLLFGREQALASIAPISGGIVATMISSDAANAAGRTDIAAFVSAIMAIQIMIGLPIASFCLKKAANNFVKKGLHKTAGAGTGRRIDLRLLPRTPKSLDVPTAHFARLAIVGAVAQVVASLTGVNATICYLLFGALCGAVGIIEKNSLKAAGGDGIMLLATYAYCSMSFVTSLQMGSLSLHCDRHQLHVWLSRDLCSRHGGCHRHHIRQGLHPRGGEPPDRLSAAEDAHCGRHFRQRRIRHPCGHHRPHDLLKEGFS